MRADSTNVLGNGFERAYSSSASSPATDPKRMNGSTLNFSATLRSITSRASVSVPVKGSSFTILEDTLRRSVRATLSIPEFSEALYFAGNPSTNCEVI